LSFNNSQLEHVTPEKPNLHSQIPFDKHAPSLRQADDPPALQPSESGVEVLTIKTHIIILKHLYR
jgi:hypothetical protein